MKTLLTSTQGDGRNMSGKKMKIRPPLFCRPSSCQLLLTALLLAPLALPGFARSASAQGVVEGFQAAARGFGSVRVELRTYGQGGQQSSWTTFAAQDAAQAKIVGSKRLADLLGFGDLKPVVGSKLPGSVLEPSDAGWWLLGSESDERWRQQLEKMGMR